MILSTALMCAVCCQVPSSPLQGIVKDHEDRPVAGAEVWLTGLPRPDDPPILASVKTNEDGRFTLERPSALAGQGADRAPVLWAYRAGSRVAVKTFPGRLPAPEEMITLQLGPPARTEFNIVDPQEKPVAGAKVRPVQLHTGHRLIPEPLYDRIAPVSDQNGLALMHEFESEEIATVDVEADGWGVQPRSYYPAAPGPKSVALILVGSLTGQIVADDPAAIRGWTVRVWTRSPDETGSDTFATGWAKVESDAEGRFTIPKLAQGRASFGLNPPASVRDRPLPRSYDGKVIQAGMENTVEIRLKHTVKLEGVLRERGTGKPIPGVQVSLSGSAERTFEWVLTDQEGRFDLPALPGKAWFSVFGLPRGWFLPDPRVNRDLVVPEGQDRLTLEPIEACPTSPPVRGIVRDAEGKPVAGASVRSTWKATIDGGSLSGIETEKTDASGRFVLDEIPPQADVELSARHQDQATAAPVGVSENQRPEMTLQLVPRPVVAFRSRVLGTDGRPIAGAVVKITRHPQSYPDSLSGYTVEFDDAAVIRTGPDGLFETPRELDPADDYRAEASAPGYFGGQTWWVTPVEDAVATFPDLVLIKGRAVRAVTGRVIDRDGKPVAGVTVLQSGDGPRRTRTTTDDQGQFRIRGVFEGAVFLFAQKAGYRFQGQIVAPGRDSVELTLTRIDEPPARRLHTLGSPIPRDEERKQALALIQPLLDTSKRSQGSGGSGDPMQTLARLDRERVLDLMENQVIGSQWLQDVALGLWEDDPAAAIRMVDDNRVPLNRAQSYLAVYLAIPEEDRTRHQDLLDRAQNEAERLGQPSQKLQFLTQIADARLARGDVERATPLVREGIDLVARGQQIAWEALRFTDVCAAIDLQEALRIVESQKGQQGSSASNIQEALARIACRIADTHPDEAEKLLEQLDPKFYDRPRFVLAACQRMARKDLDRARRLSALVLPKEPGMPGGTVMDQHFALGLMAASMNDTDPEKARALLWESVQNLAKPALEGEGATASPELLAKLLPIVERVDPDRLDEVLWLTLASRLPRVERSAYPFLMPESQAALNLDAYVAAQVSRYDSEAAVVVVRPFLERLPQLVLAPMGLGNDQQTLVGQLTLADPRGMIALIDRLPDDCVVPMPRVRNPNNAFRQEIHIKTIARSTVAWLLSLPIAQRRAEVLGEHWPYPTYQ